MTAYLNHFGTATHALALVIFVTLAIVGAACLAFNGGIVAWVVIDQAILRLLPKREAATLDELLDADDWASSNGYAPAHLNEQTEDWIFEDPSFMHADADRAEAVLFMASVMADIDDWTGGGGAA